MQLCDSMEDADLQLQDQAPDYRSDRMVSAEGRGIASARIMAFYDSCDERDSVEAFPGRAGGEEGSSSDELVPEMAQRAMERSENIGFWVVWHQAGASRPWSTPTGTGRRSSESSAGSGPLSASTPTSGAVTGSPWTSRSSGGPTSTLASRRTRDCSTSMIRTESTSAVMSTELAELSSGIDALYLS